VARAELDAHDEIELSVVVPVYGCADTLDALHRRLTPALEELAASHEIVFVDDASTDGAWGVLERLAAEDPSVGAIRLSRNFGQQAAITAGIAATHGRWIVVMDCDLQDPPELIAALYAKAAEGFDVVLARRKQKQHSLFRLLAARAYFRFISMFLGVRISGEYGAFSIISRKVRDAFVRVPDRDRHYLPILFWLGFRRGEIEYEHAKRPSGKSGYSVRALIRLAAEGIFFQTVTLLKWIVYIGFAVAASGVALAIALIVLAVVGSPPSGWTSLAVLVLVTGGFVIVSTGVTGLYVGRIFQQVKNRPLYIVDTEVGAVSGRLEPERDAIADNVGTLT
jgi:polyisoprenyl-phosphate glycosyltransferase